MLLLVVLLPLFGFFGASVFGRFIGKGADYLSTLSIFLSFGGSFYIFLDVLRNSVVYKLKMGLWMYGDSLNLNWCFCFDSLTCVMLLVVTFISTLVHLYSIEYMAHDPHKVRFMSYLSLFTFFMLILITANNFCQMFVGWEGVGLSSYLLINFWFTRIQANKAAIKAMLVNRTADVFILLGLFSIVYLFNSLDYDVVFSMAPLVVNNHLYFLNFKLYALDLICILLFLGAMGKSAQLGLHTWLPDAMEGPTPVSALIHAATMVTAGVFLLARCSYLFEFSELCLSLIMFVGATTAFFASTTGLFQNDIKKVIAYSTCSQLGYMVFACGLSSYDVGVFHLSNHAFFKALLFLGAGSVIHAVSDEQDMRKMGGLQNLLPFSYSTMLIGSLALVGFPFLAGFYSKDTILEIAFSNQTVLGHYCYYMGSFAAFFTAFYSTRLLFLVFLSAPNGNKKNILNAHEGSYYMTIPLFLLAILSIVIGYLTKEIFIGFGSDFWSTAVFILPKNYSVLDIEFISLFNKLMPLFLTILGAFFAYNLYVFNVDNYFIIKQNKNFKIIFNFLNKKWYFDRLYNQFISANILHYSFVYSYSDLDRGVIEIVGPSGVILNVNTLENKIQSLQTGNIFDYLFLITLLSFLILFIIVSFQYFNIQFFVLLLIIFFLFYFRITN